LASLQPSRWCRRFGCEPQQTWKKKFKKIQKYKNKILSLARPQASHQCRQRGRGFVKHEKKVLKQ
jgi:hypothetical protein